MEKVHFAGEKATLLITLYAKAQESLQPDSLLQDHHAAAAVARIDYDFSRLRMRHDERVGLAMRAYALDAWVREFLAAHRGATVLHLGCGLDSRVLRVDPPPDVNWFDVDYPEVIALRERLYPARPGYRMIGSSVTELAWLADVPADRPTLVVAEGLFLYLPEDDVLRLLRTVATQFPTGEIAFDAYSRLGLALVRRNRMIRATRAQMRWSLNDPLDLEADVPGLSLRTEQLMYDALDATQRLRYSWLARAALAVMQRVTPLKRLARLLRYRY